MADQFWGLRTFCLLTGGSQGIGRHFAVEFSRKFAAGSRLVLLARNINNLKDTKALITAANPQITVQVYSVDLGQPEPSVFKTILQHPDFLQDTYELHLLVHNAGSVGRSDLMAVDMDDPQEWNRYLALNLYHVTTLTSEFVRRFTTGHRCILNVTSLCAIKPFKSMGYYCVGKAAREMYFRVLAEENPDLDVVSYSPGPVETDMVTGLMSTVQDDDTKQTFLTLKNSQTFVTLEQTTQKVIALLTSRNYKSGDRHDYYDPL